MSWVMRMILLYYWYSSLGGGFPFFGLMNILYNSYVMLCYATLRYTICERILGYPVLDLDSISL